MYYYPFWILMISSLFVIGISVLIIIWSNQTLSLGIVGDVKGLKPATTVDWHKYLGTWYEAKRLDSFFEKNLSLVTANYGLLDNGSITVVNTGHRNEDGSIQIITGSAHRCSDCAAALLVSFFPFVEAPYIVLYVDDTYTTAVVGSPDRKYLWLLTRNSTVLDSQLSMLKTVALDNGYTQAQIDSMI